MSDRPSIPKRIFESLYGRMPNAAERERLLRLRNDLGLSDTDELWPLLITLDRYANRIERVGADVSKLHDELQTYRIAESKKTDRVGNLAVKDLRRLLEEAQSGLASEMHMKKKRWRITEGIALILSGIFIGIGAAYLYLRIEVGLCSMPPRFADDDVVFCVVSVTNG